MKASQAVGALIEILNEHRADIYVSNSVHEIVHRSLKDTTDQDLGLDYKLWKQWKCGENVNGKYSVIFLWMRPQLNYL